MYLIAIAWIYVVLMMAVAEALSTHGTALGAVVTFVLYGVVPVSILMYILGSPRRTRERRAVEAAELAELRAKAGVAAGAAGTAVSAEVAGGSAPPDGGGQAPGGAVAPERKEG